MSKTQGAPEGEKTKAPLSKLGTLLFEKPDTIFKRNLEQNPIFPFEIIQDNVFALTVQSSKFILHMSLVFIVLAITILYYSTKDKIDELFVFPCILFVCFARQAMFYYKPRTYILDSNSKIYEFYKGAELIYQGHYHNIYIRCIGQNSGNGEIYYNVVLDGYCIDCVTITSAIPTSKRFMKLAKKLAFRLDLNYFDPADRSRGHIIRHRCPYSKVEYKKVKTKKEGKEGKGGKTKELERPFTPLVK